MLGVDEFEEESDSMASSGRASPGLNVWMKKSKGNNSNSRLGVAPNETAAVGKRKSGFTKKETLRKLAERPHFMSNTLYHDAFNRRMSEPFKSPCAHLAKRNLDTSYHRAMGSQSPHNKKISLEKFMGLDERGARALSPLMKFVQVQNTDDKGQNSGRGPLGHSADKHLTVDL